METTELKCQSCLDRQVEQTADVVGLWQKQPICEQCLEAIMKNQDDYHFDNQGEAEESFIARKARALKLLDDLEEIYEKWPLDREETLSCHEDFYNHKPPALVNCSLAEIEEIYKRRKGLLYAVRHKDEHWSEVIEALKRDERKRHNLEGIEKSRKEVKKKGPISAESIKEKEKIARQLGIPVEKVLEMFQNARVEKFEKLIGQKKDTIPEIYPPVRENSSSSGDILRGLQEKIATKPKKRYNPVTGELLKD